MGGFGFSLCVFAGVAYFRREIAGAARSGFDYLRHMEVGSFAALASTAVLVCAYLFFLGAVS